MSLAVHSIFESISGEVCIFYQGSRAVFLRLGGCNLRCPYCDTKDTQTCDSSTTMDIKDVFRKIDSFGLKKLVITGGEPMLQQHNLLPLCTMLTDEGFDISIESNGTILPDVAFLENAMISFVMDYKIPVYFAPYAESDDTADIFQSLRSIDFIKFAVQDIQQIAEAANIQINMQANGILATFAYSPIIDTIQANSDIAIVLRDQHLGGMAAAIYSILKNFKLEAVINLQLHKILNMQ